MSLKILPDSELLKVQKPAQYLGGETGSIVKDDREIDLHFCLAFPDTYEVGMSHIGFQILYDLLNRRPATWAERCYMPLPDMEALLREKQITLSSLESKRPLNTFDIIGFSLQYELCMTGILGILDLGGIPLYSRDRDDSCPIIIGGGPVVYHPEPFADFFDAFLIGDGEELAPEFVEKFAALKNSNLSRAEKLDRLSEIDGVYVPALFEPVYSAEGKFSGMRPLKQGYTSVRRRIISSLVGAPYPSNPVVPNIKAVHDRLSVEVMRGCVRGCRFCQAGYLYRPQRERSPEEIIKIVGDSLGNTGYEELSLLSLSTADYCSILPLLSSIKEKYASNDELAVSFPSTRVDALKPELLQEVQTIRRSGFTIAPEAGTQRLRDVINKGVTDEEILQTCSNVFKLGWHSVKMYFMIGLPTETDEDIDGIIDIGKRVKAIAGPHRQVTVSVSTLVPKPHTPFQWAAQIGEQETIEKQKRIARGLKGHNVNFRYHYAFSTLLEGVFARGDRRLSSVIKRAYELGCRLEGWSEKLANEYWQQAFREHGIDMQAQLSAIPEDAPLSWDHISCDIPKSYFLKEWQRAQAIRTTPDCLTKSCSICGACDYDATRNVLFDRQRTQSRLNIINPRWEQAMNLGEQIPARPTPTAKKEKAGTYNLKEYLRTETDGGQLSARELALPVAQRVRLEYKKLGNSKFFAHLELASIFFRAMRRAGLPIAFSKGFNPKPRIIFGPPLQLGLESHCELMDVFMTRRLSDEEINNAFLCWLNDLLPAGLRISSVKEIDQSIPPIQSAVRKQTFRISTADLSELSQSVDTILSNDLWKSKTLTRMRKGKSKEVRLSDYVERISASRNYFEFDLSYSNSDGSLKPSEIADCLLSGCHKQYNLAKTATALN